LRQRMNDRGHALIAVAEGAGQHLFPAAMQGTDASNCRYHDIGPFLDDQIAAYFKRRRAGGDHIDPRHPRAGQPR
jgi:6-phosphofructokinase 1